MDLKPRIFIGSSSEGYSVAQKIFDLISDVAECILWNDVFDLNKSNYENLSLQIALYDYAILIATSDDVVISRGKKKNSARDNVLFEFGLLAGGLGRTRVFYVTEKNLKIPSDLLGISLPEILNELDPKYNASITVVANQIKKHIKDKENTFDLSFLPSTALAYGYFINFVERTVERLLEDKQQGKVFNLENNKEFKIKSLQFSILIPDDLADDMFKKVKAKRLKDDWQKLKVDPKDIRDYDFSVDVTKAEEGLLHLVDIPFTLNALNKAVELYSKKEHLGKDVKEKLLEHREIRNFKRTLEYLISSSSLAKDIVSVEVIDI
ncbi:MAG TPA: STING domain-containing protein [Parafilimonas sp.]|nr:STING domain-containing protein [Parafilimonas sp.]